MAGPSLSTDALVLLKRPPSDSFQTFTAFSAEHGPLLILLRIPKKNTGNSVALDLFDEASLVLESASQGQTWFVKEARLISRQPGLGRSYETLQAASTLAQLAARNAVSEDGRARVYALLHDAFAALATSPRPDIVYLKSLYRFARDEGYPVKEQWVPALPAADRGAVVTLLNQPAAGQTTEPALVSKLRGRLEDYLRAQTEILLD
jgi:recombinational DNA repair protein (RecF pathway)